MKLLIGTYTKNKSKGIYLYHFDGSTGATQFSTDYEVENPSYFTIGKNNTIYITTENDVPDASSVSAVSLDAINTQFNFINQQSINEAAPCYIILNREQTKLITANYLGGSITVCDLNSDYSINNISQTISFTGNSIHPKRQLQSHVHCVIFTPDYQYLLATDLGNDCIYKFSLHPDQNEYLKLEETMILTRGSGPRHLIFHPNGKYLYLINELSGTVNVFTYKDGKIDIIQSIISDVYKAEASADIHIHPNGKFLYTSNRGKHDAIIVFSIDQHTGTLTQVGKQSTLLTPRNFVICPNGKYLLVANQLSNIIQVFEIASEDGTLTDTHQNIEIDTPVCLKFLY